MKFLDATFGPTLAKERLLRLRAPGAMIWFLVYTTLLAGGCALIYFLQNPQATPAAGIGWNTGMPIFRSMAFLQLLLILLVAPGMTCPMFSQEKERGTLELLVSVPVDPNDLVMGKFLASLALLLLLVAASLPMAGICLLLGGVELWALLGTYLVMGLVVLSVGLLGAWASARFLRTTYAGIVSYGAVVLVIAWGFLEIHCGSEPVYHLLRGGVVLLLVVTATWAIMTSLVDYFHRGYSQAGCVGLTMLVLVFGCLLVSLMFSGVPELVIALNPFVIVAAVCSGGRSYGPSAIDDEVAALLGKILGSGPGGGGLGASELPALAILGALGHAALAIWFWFRTRAVLRPLLAGEAQDNYRKALSARRK